MSRARRVVRNVGLGLAVVAVLAIVLVAVVYLNRRAAAREVLVGWLERRGVQAEVQVERIELDGLVARIRVGDPTDPDFAAERVEVDYAVNSPWSPAGLGISPSRVRLLRPVLRARWADGRLSLGSLDPLVEEFTRRPPRPDRGAPQVLIEGGRVNFDTPLGRAVLLADARLEDGRLMRLQGRMGPTTLQGRDVSAQGLSGTVSATTVGDRLSLRLDVAATAGRTPDLSFDGARLSLNGEVAYPDLKQRRGDGRAVLALTGSAEGLEAGGARLKGVSMRGDFDGMTAGWIDAFRLEGRSRLDLAARSLASQGLSATALSVTSGRSDSALTRDAQGLRWTVEGPAGVSAGRLAAGDAVFEGLRLSATSLTAGGRGAAMEAAGPLALTAQRFRFGELRLDDVAGRAAVDARADGAVLVQARTSLTARRGAWPLFGPARADDADDLKAMKAALGDFSVSAPSLHVTLGSPGSTVVLERPVDLRPRSGGVLRLSASSRAPVFSSDAGPRGGGALTVAAERGPGFPDLAIAVPDWRLTPGGFEARLDGRAALDFDLFRGVTVETKGRLASTNGRLTFAGDGCAAVAMERLELDENDVTDLSGRFCPNGAPLVVIENGRWTARGRLADVEAAAPFMAMRFSDAAGDLVASGGDAGVALRADVTTAKVQDATTPRRFNPLTASGSASLSDERWSGGFDLASGSTPVGRLTLNHDGRAGAGGIVIETPTLTFAEGGLQPADLSPLVEAFIQPPAIGQAQFSGRIDWVADGEGSSSGRLVVPSLDFVSPAGPVKGLKGEVEFTSLIPLTTAPGQRLTADSLESVTPLTDAEVAFALDKSGVVISGADVHVAGGTVRVEPFTVPLDPTQGFEGVIVLDNVQLGEVLAGSGFGDKASLDAVVSGRLPFRSAPGQGVRITGGTLNAVQPGRLSIQREALSGVEAGGGGAEVPPNTVQDLAYQAMENLAFDILTAEVNSLDEGRLGVLFHIRGRHDPPQRQELRLSLSELISREFLKRDLPLPSGTQVDLTLDTTLNADQLFGDLLALNRARNGSAPTP